MKERHSKIKIDKNEASKVSSKWKDRVKNKTPFLVTAAKVLLVVVVVVSLIFISAKSFANVTMSNVTDSIRGVFVNLSRGDGYPYELPVDGVIQSDTIGTYLAVVESDKLVYLNSTAKEVLKYDHNFTEPVLKTRNGRGLFYNRGSSEFIVTGESEVLFDNTKTSAVMDDPIITADLGKRGDIAFATWSDEGVSKVSVYDSSLKEKFYYVFSSGRVADVSLSENGKYFSAAVIDAENAQLYSRILIFDITKSKPVVDKKLSTETAVDVEYFSSSEISVLTLSSCFTMDSTSGEISPNKLDFKNGVIEEYSFDSESGEAALAVSEYGGNSDVLRGFSGLGKEKFSLQLNGIRKISKSDNYTAVLTEDKIYCYSDSGKLKCEIDLPVNVDDIELNKKMLYIFSGNNIYRLKVSKWSEFEVW